MDAIRKKAFKELEENLALLYQAVNDDDMQDQLVAIHKAIDALQDAKKATASKCGGIMN